MSTEWNALAKLACGNIEQNKNETKDILFRLGNSISSFSNHLLGLSPAKDDDRLIVPFLSRSILESISTALITRFDPFRVMVIRNVQQQGHYETTVPADVSIRWARDVMMSKDSSEQNIWRSELTLDKFNRALFSKHNYDILWKLAHSRFMEYYAEHVHINTEIPASEWMIQLVSKNDNDFFNYTRSSLSQLFSFFSKGIHFEFIVEPSEIYDEITVTAKAKTLFEVTSSALMIGNFINIMNVGLTEGEAFDCFFEVERMVGDGFQ